MTLSSDHVGGIFVGLAASSQCLDCAAGSYCSGPGLVAVSGDCDAGFYCESRAESSMPLDGVTGQKEI